VVETTTEASLQDASRGVLRRPVVGGVEVLSRRLRREFELNTNPGERVRLCLRGVLGHALVCLDDRVLILKRGLHAGTLFGSMSATIFYRDVTGIQVGRHLFSAWIEIQSPSFQGRERRRASRPAMTDRDSFKQPNCISIRRRHMAVYQLALLELRRFVADQKVEPDRHGVVDQLERLASLRRQGVIDEHEFRLAKEQLLQNADRTAA
jgi:hypothetical protein